jgi:hypothetical protein
MVSEPLSKLLAKRGLTWESARGTARHWKRQDLVNHAFALSHASQDWMFQPERDETVASSGAVVERVIAVSTVRSPRLVRERLVSRVGDEWAPSLFVANQDWSWIVDAGTIRDNAGDAEVENGLHLADLLRFDLSAGWFVLTPGGTATRAGRPCFIVTAEPSEPADGEVRFPTPFAMVAGGDRFALSVDAERGVVLAAEKIVAGEVAEVSEFVTIEFDVELDEQEFSISSST